MMSRLELCTCSDLTPAQVKQADRTTASIAKIRDSFLQGGTAASFDSKGYQIGRIVPYGSLGHADEAWPATCAPHLIERRFGKAKPTRSFADAKQTLLGLIGNDDKTCLRATLRSRGAEDVVPCGGKRVSWDIHDWCELRRDGDACRCAGSRLCIDRFGRGRCRREPNISHSVLGHLSSPQTWRPNCLHLKPMSCRPERCTHVNVGPGPLSSSD